MMCAMLPTQKPRLMSCSKKDITQQLSTEDLSLLLRQGDGRIISSQSLVTKDRVEAIIRDDNTHRIAQDVAVELIKLTSETNTPVAAVAKPLDFQDIAAGINARVTPVISDNGESISIEITSEFIEDIEFFPKAIGCVHSEKGELNLTTETAVVKRHAVQTIVTIQNGDTLLLGGGTTTKDDEDVYVFVSCKTLSSRSNVPIK